MFCHFLAKIRKFKMAAIFWGGENFLKIAKTRMLRYPVGENFDEIALSRTVKEIEVNFVFCHFW